MRGRGPRGMTMIETIVMLGLVAIFGTIALPMISDTMRNVDRNEAIAAQYEVGRQALTDICTHLRQATALPGAGAPVLVGVNSAGAAIPQDRLSVTTTDLTRLAAGTVFTAEYFVVPPDLQQQAPAHLEQRLTAPDGTTSARPIGAHIVGFDCLYRTNGSWVTEWSAPTLPDAVRVTVYVTARIGAPARPMFTEVNLTGHAG